jgi:integrase
MSSVYQKDGRFYLRYKDGKGRWRGCVSNAKTKTEARRLAAEMEAKGERERRGLPPEEPAETSETLDELLKWWIATYFEGAPSYERSVGTIRRHLIGSELGASRVVSITPAAIEVFLHAKSKTLSPQSVNHLRGYLSRAFNAGRRAGRFSMTNPVADVKRRKVPKRVPDYLKQHEVPLVLAALPAARRALFATAIYTGLRKGELFGLRKSDVDLPNRLLTVSRSYERETTKSGRAEVIPIAAELVPYLETAIAASPSDLVFPRADGEMQSSKLQLEVILRRALGRAGIVTGYLHRCRRKGCGHVEAAPDAELKRCPKCNMKLWPSPQVRRIRFHHLRHTTASLLMMRGANPAAVQRILRHSDPRITTETYGHLAPDYLKSEIDRLSFGPAPFATYLLRSDGEVAKHEEDASRNLASIQALLVERATGLEPATACLGSRYSTN